MSDFFESVLCSKCGGIVTDDATFTDVDGHVFHALPCYVNVLRTQLATAQAQAREAEKVSAGLREALTWLLNKLPAANVLLTADAHARVTRALAAPANSVETAIEKARAALASAVRYTACPGAIEQEFALIDIATVDAALALLAPLVRK